MENCVLFFHDLAIPFFYPFPSLIWIIPLLCFSPQKCLQTEAKRLDVDNLLMHLQQKNPDLNKKKEKAKKSFATINL